MNKPNIDNGFVMCTPVVKYKVNVSRYDRCDPINVCDNQNKNDVF